MDIVENLDQWQAEFESGWLAHLQKTGQTDFTLYPRPENKISPVGPGVDLSKSRLMLISTAGAYLADTQQPFDAPNPIGDYTIRLFPVDTPFEALAYAHEHYDHADVNADPQVLLPLRHLKQMVDEGKIGQLAPTVISYSGYQPDLVQIVNSLIPAIIEAVNAEKPDAVLLVPA